MTHLRRFDAFRKISSISQTRTIEMNKSLVLAALIAAAALTACGKKEEAPAPAPAPEAAASSAAEAASAAGAAADAAASAAGAAMDS
ncbi:MAG: hypothetical protein QM614_09315, partial [Ottowia sp.]